MCRKKGFIEGGLRAVKSFLEDFQKTARSRSTCRAPLPQPARSHNPFRPGISACPIPARLAGCLRQRRCWSALVSSHPLQPRPLPDPARTGAQTQPWLPREDTSCVEETISAAPPSPGPPVAVAAGLDADHSRPAFVPAAHPAECVVPDSGAGPGCGGLAARASRTATPGALPATALWCDIALVTALRLVRGQLPSAARQTTQGLTDCVSCGSLRTKYHNHRQLQLLSL